LSARGENLNINEGAMDSKKCDTVSWTCGCKIQNHAEPGSPTLNGMTAWCYTHHQMLSACSYEWQERALKSEADLRDRELQVGQYRAALEKIADPMSDTHHVCCANWPESKGYPCNCDTCTAKAALTERPVCQHKWAHIEDHHVICEKCKHVADLCWPHENEKPCRECGEKAKQDLKCNCGDEMHRGGCPLGGAQ